MAGFRRKGSFVRSRVLLTGMMLATLAACTEPTVTNTPDESSTSTDAGSTAVPQQQTLVPAAAAGVGGGITLVGSDENLKVRVTVVSIADPASPKNAEFSSLEAGSRFVGVQLNLENVGTVAYSDSPTNGAKLIDTQGQQYDPEIAEEITQGPGIGATVTIAAGSNASGWMVFQIAQSTQLRTFQMALDSGFADQHGEWTLGEG